MMSHNIDAIKWQYVAGGRLFGDTCSIQWAKQVTFVSVAREPEY